MKSYAEIGFGTSIYCLTLIFPDKPFYYRGCGWKKANANVKWSIEDKDWIRSMDNLFCHLFGPDSCQFQTKDKKCFVVEGQLPLMDQNHSDWKINLSTTITQGAYVCVGEENKPVEESNVATSRSVVQDNRKTIKAKKEIVNQLNSTLHSVSAQPYTWQSDSW